MYLLEFRCCTYLRCEAYFKCGADSRIYGTLLYFTTGHKNKKYCVFCCFFTVGGTKWILSGSEDNALYIWDLKTTNLIWTLEEHKDVVLSCDAHPTLPMIVSGSLDKSLKLWRWNS